MIRRASYSPSNYRQTAMYDVIIVGGGPAGLSAALVLGRCTRRVVLVDAGHPRNAASLHLHGFLSRDGISPHDLLTASREQLKPYDVKQIKATATHAQCEESGFRVTLDDGASLTSRKLILATGIVDPLPQVPGLRELYGRSVHHCPYCDGWERRGSRLAAYGSGSSGAKLALLLRSWSSDVVLCTDGPAQLEKREREHLAAKNVVVREERLAELIGKDGALQRICFREPSMSLERDAMFFTTGHYQHSDLAKGLGCAMDEHGGVVTDDREGTGVAGLYLAGDASRDVQLAIHAAAEGATAAVAINGELVREAGLQLA